LDEPLPCRPGPSTEWIAGAAAVVVLTLGALVLLASATGVVLELRAESGDFPLAQLLVAVLAGAAMPRAAAVLRHERRET
jgi:hypothetical protein